MRLRPEVIFAPETCSEYTYVSRFYKSTGITYDLRLKQALRITGFLTLMVGPSKTGKTTLCKKVIGLENMIEISAKDFNNHNGFWTMAAVAAKVKFSDVGDLAAVKEYQNRKDLPDNTCSERNRLFRNQVIQYYKDHEKVLVIDMFHCASAELQMTISQQLKYAILREMKIVIVSLPDSVDHTIRKNPELSGRLNLINMESWKKRELAEIAIRGFTQLNIDISGSMAEIIAEECYFSPQRMQDICFNVCICLKDQGCNMVDKSTLEFVIANINSVRPNMNRDKNLQDS